MSRRMLLIPVDGEPRIVEPGDFRGMAAAIGADYVERVRVAEEWALAVDEEGLLTGRDVNRRATLLYNFAITVAHPGCHPTQPICGDVLLAREGFVGDGVDYLDTDAGDALAFLSERGAA